MRRFIRITSVIRTTLLIQVMALSGLMLPSSGSSQPRVAQVEATWEDSIAVIHPQISSPFNVETHQALMSGLPVALDIEVRFQRTGYVQTIRRRVDVEYYVWKNRFRVVTPIGPLAVNDYQTLLRLFRNDLIVTIHPDELLNDGPWLVSVRAGEVRVHDGRDEGESGIEKELSTLTAWLFRRSSSEVIFGDWSRLAQLPRFTPSDRGNR